MAVAVERLLGRRITAGLVNAPNALKLRRIEINREAAIRSQIGAGVAGAKRIAQIASNAGLDDLIVCLISGGRLGPVAAARAPDHAGGKTSGHAIVAALRRQYPRDELRAEAHLAAQRRAIGAAGVSGDTCHADSFRRHRRPSGRDRLGAHGARSHNIR